MNRVTSVAVTLLLAGLAHPAFAAPAGSWAAFGHDFQRTGHADVPAKMKAPKVAWTLPLGGLVGAQQALIADVDGDGRPETVNIAGGRVVASRPDGTTLWATGLVGPTAVLGAWDLVGDGSPEVVVDATGGALVLGGKDGHTLTTLPSTVPMQGAFAPEGTGGILILAASAGPISAYDFRNGTNVTTPSWTITGADQPSVLVGDVDGDGSPELVRPLNDGFEVDDPLTGSTKYALPAMGPAAYFYDFGLANVDSTPGLEIIAVDTSYIYSPQTGIYVLGVKNGALGTLWSSTASPSVAVGADYFSLAGAVADLDGNGTLELVFSKWDGTAQTWTTVIADAAAGTALGTVPNGFLQAVADVDGDGKAELATRAGVLGNRTPERSTLSVYDFDSAQTGPVAKSWSVQVAHVMTALSIQPPGPGLPASVIADFDPSVPGLEMLLGVDQKNANADTNVLVVHGGDGTVASSYAVPATVHPSVIGTANKITSAMSSNDVVLAQDDGSVQLLDHTLSDRAHFSSGTYSNWIRAVVTGSGMANLYAATSNNHLSWVDGRQLHASGAPYVRFDEPSILATSGFAAGGFPLDPIVFLNGPSGTIVTFEQQATRVTVVAHGFSGQATWSLQLDNGSTVYFPGSYALDLTGDGTDDLVLTVIDANASESLSVYDGVTGMLVRSATVSAVISGGGAFTTGSLVDVNGDGRPDLVAPEESLGEIAAVDLFAQPFAQIWLAPQGSLPAAFNGTVSSSSAFDAGASALFRTNGNNGFGPYERLALSGSIAANGDQGLPTGDGYDQNAAVLVNAGSHYDLVAAGSADVGLSRVRRVAGDTLSTVWTVYAANGVVGPNSPSAAYPLRDPVAIDVDGNGNDDIVVGSDDGYLYALNSTDGSLLFAVNLGAPVSHLIAANIDLDSDSELVASLSDGRLVALDDNYQAMHDAPDAGADASSEAGPDAGDAGRGDGGDAAAGNEDGGDGSAEGGQPGETSNGGGCGCATVGSGGTTSITAMLVLAGAVLGRSVRRKRRSRPTS